MVASETGRCEIDSEALGICWELQFVRDGYMQVESFLNLYNYVLVTEIRN